MLREEFDQRNVPFLNSARLGGIEPRHAGEARQIETREEKIVALICFQVGEEKVERHELESASKT